MSSTYRWSRLSCVDRTFQTVLMSVTWNTRNSSHYYIKLH